MKPIIIKPADIIVLMEQAKEHLLSLPPQARLGHGTRALSEGERLALSYLTSVLGLLQKHGLDTSRVMVGIREADSDPIE